jgi:hypothetical protein
MNVKREEKTLVLEAQIKNNLNTGAIHPPESLSEEQALGKLQRYKTIFRCGCSTVKE